MKIPLLVLEGIEKKYKNGAHIENISFAIDEGQFVALIGESGSGKTTIGKIISGMIAPTNGKILYKGAPVVPSDRAERKVWGTRVQQIFQNPYTSLNPTMKVKDIILEGVHYHEKLDYGGDKKAYVTSLMKAVELDDALENRYPRELSGGQCQRVSIARALAMKPDLLVADECISSLDSIHQHQILKLLLQIKEKEQIACLFITHDMQVLRKIADYVIVVKEGRIVEQGPYADMVKAPKHSYTKELIEATFML